MIHVFLFDQSAVLQNLQALKVFLISPSCRWMEAPLAKGLVLTPASTGCSARTGQKPVPCPFTGAVSSPGPCASWRHGVIAAWVTQRLRGPQLSCRDTSREAGVRMFWTLAVTIHISGSLHSNICTRKSARSVTGLDKYLIKK